MSLPSETALADIALDGAAFPRVRPCWAPPRPSLVVSLPRSVCCPRAHGSPRCFIVEPNRPRSVFGPCSGSSAPDHAPSTRVCCGSYPRSARASSRSGAGQVGHLLPMVDTQDSAPLGDCARRVRQERGHEDYGEGEGNVSVPREPCVLGKSTGRQ